MTSGAVAIDPKEVGGIAFDSPESLPPTDTTTTISTIAVRAEPHSTIVVALLKSIGFVELRIDKMRPGLLEIGSDPRENSHLLGIHDDLFRRLLGKQQQVEELLGRAEKLVQEQTEPSDMIVYEAMADGLAAAWRGLSRQLAMRGFILADTQRLYELALKHEELAKLANSKLQHINVAKEGHTPEMGPIVNELAELTRDGLEIGSDVITQIRLLGSLNDNAQRPRETLDACLAIEKVMLSMAQSWEFVERIRRERGLHAQDAAQLGQVQYQRIQQNGHKKVQQNGKSVIRHEIENLSQFERKTGKDHEAHLDAAEQWLHTGQQRFLLIRRGGEQEEQEDEELELSVLANETRANQASLKALDEQQLAHPLGTRCAELLERYSRFLKEVQQREELLERSAVMLRGSDMLISQLAKMRDELHNADAPMAGELGPLAQQKGIALIEEGGILVKSWESEGGSGQWKEHILERVERLKEAVIEVVQLARERIAAGKAEKLREKLGLLEQWLHTVARPLLSEPVQLGPGAAETSEFLSRHRRFSTDLSAREHEMRSLLSAQQKSQPLDTGEEQRLDNVHKGVGRVRQMLDTRIRLAQQLEQSLKLDRELDTSLHFLATLLQQKANQSAPQPRYQMRNLLQQTNEHIYRERHEAEKFADLAGGLTNERLDPNLALRPALEWSKEKLASHEQEFNRLSQMCEQWEEGKDRRRDGATAKGVPPRIVFPLPVEQAVLQGLRLELSARVEGQPEPQVRWLKDADVLAERIGHCRMDWLNGTATLVIEEVLAEDEGDYTLQAANGLGQTETKCRLIVQEVPRGMLQKGKHQLGTQSAGEPQPMDSGSVPQPTPGESKPRFVRQLESVSVPEGASFLLDCVVVGDPEPKIIWYREEQTVRESDHVRLHFRGDHCSLHCEDAHGEDAGLYKVLAVNRHGETMNFCRVCIIPPSPKRSRVPPPTPPKPATPIQARRVSIPSIVPQPARIESQLCSQVAREGEPAQFQTQLRGWPVPEVHWLHNGQPIVAANRSDLSITTDIGEAVATVALRIPNVSLDHAGQYTLLARNEHAEVRSSATLNVLLDVVSGTAAEVDPFDLWLQKQGGQQRPKQQSQSPVKLTHSDLFLSQSPTKLQFPSQPQSPTKSFAAHQFGLQSPSSVGYEQIHQRWQQTHFGASQSPHQGVVYAVTKSDRAESRRSSDFGDPVYSSIAKAPEFIRAFQPEVTVIEGQNAEIDCLMVANPRPKVQWFFNDGLIRACPDFVEFSNIGDTYAVHFRAAPLECAGYYRLVAENVRGKADSQVLVHVRPKSMVAQPGHRRSLGGGPGGVQALLKQQRERQWAQLYQHRAVSTPPRPPASSCGSGSALASPLPPFAGVPATTAMSTSVYAAELERELFAFPKQQQQHSPRDAQQQGKSSAAFQLMETQQQFRRTPPQPKGSPPHFLQTLVSVVVAEGAQAKFEAVVTGLPNPRLEWSKDGRPVVEGGNVRCWTEGGRAALIVESAGRTDTGKYCCTAENQSGMASSSAQLVLRPKAVAPDFEQRLISEELEEGGKMQWTVQTSGEPEPAVRWLRDGAPVQDGQGGVRLIKECPFVYSLSIDPLRLEDGGQFTCVLENTAGEARSTADLMVRRKGSAPGKYVHVTKVSQERQSRAEELLAQSETVTVDESLGTGSLEEEEDGDVDV